MLQLRQNKERFMGELGRARDQARPSDSSRDKYNVFEQKVDEFWTDLDYVYLASGSTAQAGFELIFNDFVRDITTIFTAFEEKLDAKTARYNRASSQKYILFWYFDGKSCVALQAYMELAMVVVAIMKAALVHGQMSGFVYGNHDAAYKQRLSGSAAELCAKQSKAHTKLIRALKSADKIPNDLVPHEEWLGTFHDWNGSADSLESMSKCWFRGESFQPGEIVELETKSVTSPRQESVSDFRNGVKKETQDDSEQTSLVESEASVAIEKRRQERVQKLQKDLIDVRARWARDREDLANENEKLKIEMQEMKEKLENQTERYKKVKLAYFRLADEIGSLKQQLKDGKPVMEVDQSNRPAIERQKSTSERNEASGNDATVDSSTHSRHDSVRRVSAIQQPAIPSSPKDMEKPALPAQPVDEKHPPLSPADEKRRQRVRLRELYELQLSRDEIMEIMKDHFGQNGTDLQDWDQVLEFWAFRSGRGMDKNEEKDHE